MAITLPLPLRVAAGILGTGLDRVRALPEDIPALPVSLVGNAMRLSMKLQQEIATLATRGDELLGGVIGAPQENPSWARFDDDEPAAPPPPRPRNANGRRMTASGPDRTDDRSDDGTDSPAATVPDGSAEGTHHLKTPETTALAPETTIAMAAAVEVPAAVVEQALVAADDAEQLLDEQAADAVIDDIVEAVAGGADAAVLAAVSDEVADEAAEEAAAELEEALVEEAVQEEALIEETVLEEAVLEEALVQVAEEEAVLEDALVEVATDEAILEQELEAVVRQHAEEEVALEEAIEETILAETVLEEALEETLDEEADIEAALDEEADIEAALEDTQDGSSIGTNGADLPLAGYDRLTLAQVRGHLRDLSADDVAALLEYERDTENRPPFLTLLSNRLVTLDAQNS